jgi:hypothetical protein
MYCYLFLSKETNPAVLQQRHEQKPRQKLALPNKTKNKQIIACWYVTHIRRNKKKEKKE